MQAIDMDSSQSSTLTSGVFRSVSNSPPTHCSVIIESFSLLSEFMDSSEEPKDAYKSEEFKAGGYKWKLLIYTKGNKKKMVEDHISVYLQIAATNSLEMDFKVYVDFRVFVLDQNKNSYIVFEDALTKTNCISGTKLDVGFDKLVSLKEFNDKSYGYLVDDECVFGAEVFVCKETRKEMREYLTRLKPPTTYRHLWTVENFSSLNDLYYTSEPFIVEGQKWVVRLYPRGENLQNRRTSEKRRISTYLVLADGKTTQPVTKVYAESCIRILNPTWRNSESPAKWCYTSNQLGDPINEWYWVWKNLDYATSLNFKRLLIETTLTIYGVTKISSYLKEQKKTEVVNVDLGDQNEKSKVANVDLEEQKEKTKVVSVDSKKGITTKIVFVAVLGLWLLTAKKQA